MTVARTNIAVPQPLLAIFTVFYSYPCLSFGSVLQNLARCLPRPVKLSETKGNHRTTCHYIKYTKETQA